MADEAMGAQVLTGATGAAAKAIDALSRVMTELARQANERHGEASVAKAFLKGVPCCVSAFEGTRQDEKKERAFRQELLKQKVDFSELKKENGGTLVIFREEDLNRVQDINKKLEERGLQMQSPEEPKKKQNIDR